MPYLLAFIGRIVGSCAAFTFLFAFGDCNIEGVGAIEAVDGIAAVVFTAEVLKFG